mmetsp:Transcript_16159/g.31606  ORF Transcript_16159/g.31606 Transcript_16159/m.31606 type:complete len:188 (+) Transcript_16159:81-644(+)
MDRNQVASAPHFSTAKVGAMNAPPHVRQREGMALSRSKEATHTEKRSSLLRSKSFSGTWSHNKQHQGAEKLEDRCDEVLFRLAQLDSGCGQVHNELSRLSDKNRTLRRHSAGLREKTRQEFPCRTLPSTQSLSLWNNTAPQYETEFRRSFQRKLSSFDTAKGEQGAKGHGRYRAISQWGADPIFFYR